jgi:hypothetical protein
MARFSTRYEIEPLPYTEGRFSAFPGSIVEESTNSIVYEVAIATVSWIPAIMYELWGLPETDRNAQWGSTTTFHQLVSSEDKDAGTYRLQIFW